MGLSSLRSAATLIRLTSFARLASRRESRRVGTVHARSGFATASHSEAFFYNPSAAIRGTVAYDTLERETT
jgi:hypothetical protein